MDRRDDDFHQQVAQRLTLERPLPGEGLEDDDAERPEVAPRVDGLRPLCLFGAHVVGRPEHRAGSRARPGSAGAGRFGDAEIEHLGDLSVVVTNEEDIVRLEVAVHDPLRVRLRQGTADLSNDGDKVMRGQPADARQTLAEVLAVEQFHGDVRRPVADSVIEDLNDVRASQVGGGLCLALEARLDFGKLRPLPFDELDGTRNVQPEVRRKPHRAHPAAPEQSVEAESLGDDYVRRRLYRHATAPSL
jgi:hypothetical protein